MITRQIVFGHNWSKYLPVLKWRFHLTVRKTCWTYSEITLCRTIETSLVEFSAASFPQKTRLAGGEMGSVQCQVNYTHLDSIALNFSTKEVVSASSIAITLEGSQRVDGAIIQFSRKPQKSEEIRTQ